MRESNAVVRQIWASLIVAEQLPAVGANQAVEYYLRNGQVGWALFAIILGLPASWKMLGLIGKFFARRFDNRDDLVKHLVDAQTKEMSIRLAEANSRTAIAESLTKSAEAHLKAADAHQKQCEAMMELARVGRK